MRHYRLSPGWRFRGVLLAWAALLAAQPAAAAVNTFTLVVPRKPLPQLQMSRIIVTVQVNTEAAIDFTVTPPVGEGVAASTGAMSPGVAPSAVSLFFGIVQVLPPDTTGLGASDPRRRNYKFVFTPTTDFGGSCQTAMAGNSETWTIAVTGGASRITDACAVSLDENIPADECNGTFRLVPNTEPFAELGGLSSQEQTCRFGLDAMLVLDRSGSMGWEARPADPPGPSNVRIVSLRNAVDSFVNTLTTVRATEVSNFGAAPNDNVGVVIFNHDAADLPGLAAGLNVFNPANATAINTGIGGTSPSGSTSIGDGVFSADAHLGGAVASRRHVMLLMSDGQQNTDRLLGADVAAGRVFTHPPGTACPPGDVTCVDLAHLGTYQIYTVTVGLGVGPAAEQLNQDVALATGGFYLNSEDDAGELTAFFGGLLQNFLETATWQTVLSGFDSATPTTPFTVRVPITATTQAVVVTLSPRVSGRGFCLEVTPPGGTSREPSCGTGVLTASFTPADISRHLGGEWEIEVEARETPQDFHLQVLADDVGVGARVTTSSSTYAPGDPVRVEARLSAFGVPILNLDESRLRAVLASPTTTIGDLLAASSAGTSLPATGDSAIDDANAKVQNEVEGNPSALATTPGSVTLRDDGAGPDRTAGDGVYSAEFSLTQYGNVDLVVTLAGESPGGAFLRQKNETVHLRSVPDGGATQVSTQVVSTADGNQLVIQLVPKTRFGFHIGPGWGNYLWFAASNGQTVKPRDNLDGSYTATVPFTGTTPPEVDVHVITDSVVITDDVPPDKLPEALDDDNVLVGGITGGAVLGPWSLSIHAGLADPQGNFANACDGGVGWGLDIEYLFTPALAAELFYGRDRLDCGGFGFQQDLQHLAINGKVYFGPTTPRLFVLGGIGSYDLGNIATGQTETGVALGAGVQFNPLPQLALEFTGKYHRIDTVPFDLDLATLQFGLRWRL